MNSLLVSFCALFGLLSPVSSHHCCPPASCLHHDQLIMIQGSYNSYRYRNGPCHPLMGVDWFPPQMDQGEPHTVQLYQSFDCSGDEAEVDCPKDLGGECCKGPNNCLHITEPPCGSECFHESPGFLAFDVPMGFTDLDGVLHWCLDSDRYDLVQTLEFYVGFDLVNTDCCSIDSFLYEIACDQPC